MPPPFPPQKLAPPSSPHCCYRSAHIRTAINMTTEQKMRKAIDSCHSHSLRYYCTKHIQWTIQNKNNCERHFLPAHNNVELSIWRQLIFYFISSVFVDNPARMQLILQIGSHKSAHAGASIGREMLQENMAIQGSDAKEEKEDLKCADKSLTQWWAQQEVALINIGHGAPLSSDFSSSHFQKQKISNSLEWCTNASSDKAQMTVRQSRLTIRSPTPLRSAHIPPPHQKGSSSPHAASVSAYEAYVVQRPFKLETWSRGC